MAHIVIPPIVIDLNDYITPNINCTLNTNIDSKVTSFNNSIDIDTKNLNTNVTKILEIDTAAQEAFEKEVVLTTNSIEEE